MQGRQRVLTVTSTHTGGMPQTNRDLMSALLTGGPGTVEVWHLNAIHEKLTLSRVHADGREETVHTHSLPEAVSPLTHHSKTYDAVVAAWLHQGGFDVVHVHHLAWHGLGLLRLAKAARARVVVSFHDFYHLCPSVKLLDADGHSCGGRCTAGPADCAPEPMWPGLNFPRLRGAWVGEWRHVAAQALAEADAFVAPHASVRDTLLQHLALPGATPFHVIPHGRNFDRVQWRGQLPKRGQVLEVLVPGHLMPAKGLEMVRGLAAMDGGRRLHLHVLGPVAEPLSPAPGLTQHGEYRVEEFSSRVAQIRPHVGAVFSIWNETWCHTLTEMWACGLPVMAFDFPTVGGRIRETGAGWVWPLEPVAALYERILALDFLEISRKTARTAALKPALERQSCQVMAQRYHEVYGWAPESLPSGRVCT